MKIDLAHLLSLYAAATPGDWVTNTYGVIESTARSTFSGEPIAFHCTSADTAYIVAAHAAFPELLAMAARAGLAASDCPDVRRAVLAGVQERGEAVSHHNDNYVHRALYNTAIAQRDEARAQLAAAISRAEVAERKVEITVDCLRVYAEGAQSKVYAAVALASIAAVDTSATEARK